MTSWFQDLRYALRQLRKSPGFTIAAVMTLALGIGANAVVFSVMNGLILRPLNMPQAESLYLIERASDKDTSQSYPDYLDLRDRNRSFDSLAAYSITQVAMNTREGPSLIWGMESSSNYFDALRIRPYLGRFFNPSDDHGPNSAPYIVLSYAYWHSHFHDDRGVLGRAVQLNNSKQIRHWSLMRMLYWPLRSPFSTSKHLPGNTARSVSTTDEASSCPPKP